MDRPKGCGKIPELTDEDWQHWVWSSDGSNSRLHCIWPIHSLNEKVRCGRVRGYDDYWRNSAGFCISCLRREGYIW